MAKHVDLNLTQKEMYALRDFLCEEWPMDAALVRVMKKLADLDDRPSKAWRDDV